MGWCTLRFRSVDQISTACTIAGVMMYSLKKSRSESANSQEILVQGTILEKWPVAVGKRGYRRLSFSLRLEADFVVHRTSQPLFAAQISLHCLHRDVSQQKLDLFQL